MDAEFRRDKKYILNPLVLCSPFPAVQRGDPFSLGMKPARLPASRILARASTLVKSLLTPTERSALASGWVAGFVQLT